MSTLFSSAGKMADLGTLGGEYSAAHGINRFGDVVGYAYKTNGGFHAFFYSAGTMHDLGTLGGAYSTASAINDYGQITGQAYTSGNLGAHAFLYNGGKMTDLGVLNHVYSEGDAINGFGMVVGRASIKNNTGYLVYHAVIYSNGRAIDLNRLIPAGSGWVLEQATGINDKGQIVGFGKIHSQDHGFLLTPQ